MITDSITSRRGGDMNRSIRTALASATLVLGLGLAACTDTTQEPTSTVTETNAFEDPGAYRAFLAKIYAGLAVSGQQGPAGLPDISGIDEGFSQYLRLYWEAQELPTDEAVIAWGDVGLPEMNTQLWASSNSFVVAMYYRVYFQVAMANEFLRQTTEAKLDERGVGGALRADIQRFRAEARFLRALSYWHGIDFFGPIPLVLEDAPLNGDPPAQSTRAEVFDFLVSELNAIRADLPPAGTGGYGRATDAAASMLLAKLYLNARVYTGTARDAEALAATEAVIAGPYTLDPNFRRPFLADNHTSPEIIFPVVQDGSTTQTWGGMTFLVHASCGGTMSNAALGLDGCWFGLRLKPQAVLRYAAGDPRASFFHTDGQTLEIASIGEFTNGYANPKFQNVTSTGSAGSQGTHVDTDFPMFRLADAYLMYAEAVLRGGGGSPDQALTYLNALRERVYGDASGNIAAPALTLDFILDERGRELLWEAHRRTDLIRYGQFTGSTLWSWKGGVQSGTATESFRDLYPLPASELVTNPNLVQNPGY
jgi:hypothetical protein